MGKAETVLHGDWLLALYDRAPEASESNMAGVRWRFLHPYILVPTFILTMGNRIDDLKKE